MIRSVKLNNDWNNWKEVEDQPEQSIQPHQMVQMTVAMMAAVTVVAEVTLKPLLMETAKHHQPPNIYDTMASNETFSFDTVAVLVANLSKKGVTLGMKDYTQMAKLDGKRTASSFDHGFRKVKARARELLAEAGEADVARASPRDERCVRTPAPRKRESQVCDSAGGV